MSEREALAVLQAEQELQAIETLADHACLSPIARERIAEAAETIRDALQVKRAEVGLRPRAAA